MSHWSGARESREIERGNLSIQSLNPVSGHILTSLGRAEKMYAPHYKVIGRARDSLAPDQ